MWVAWVKFLSGLCGLRGSKNFFTWVIIFTWVAWVDVRSSLDTKFHFKQKIFNFETKFAQKGYFRSKTEKVNITTEFSIFELM